MNIIEILKKNYGPLLIILISFLIDRITKNLILRNSEQNTIFINDFLNFDLVWNTGIGFGLLSLGNSFFYNIVTILIFLIIIYIVYMFKKLPMSEKYYFALILGGAVGNFYDRVDLHAVPDFIDLHYKDFHWFTFNFADIFITLGVLLLILTNIFKKNEN
tara:strand:- start:4 stop:483 length:480 start_codon:yes stop_codon:yes gene_type:complete